MFPKSVVLLLALAGMSSAPAPKLSGVVADTIFCYDSATGATADIDLRDNANIFTPDWDDEIASIDEPEAVFLFDLLEVEVNPVDCTPAQIQTYMENTYIEWGPNAQNTQKVSFLELLNIVFDQSLDGETAGTPKARVLNGNVRRRWQSKGVHLVDLHSHIFRVVRAASTLTSTIRVTIRTRSVAMLKSKFDELQRNPEGATCGGVTEKAVEQLNAQKRLTAPAVGAAK